MAENQRLGQGPRAAAVHSYPPLSFSPLPWGEAFSTPTCLQTSAKVACGRASSELSLAPILSYRAILAMPRRCAFGDQPGLLGGVWTQEAVCPSLWPIPVVGAADSP